MSLPGPEVRIAAQERFTNLLAARIEELSQSMESNFRRLSEHMDLGFRQAHAYIEEHMATKEDIVRIEVRLDKIETEHGQLLREILARLPSK